MNKKEIWNTNLEKEVMWWKKKWMNNPRSSFPWKTNPDTECQEYISKWFPATFPDNFRILDVGAGPLTHIGKKYQGNYLDITAVDALADEYYIFVEELINNYGLKVKTKKCQTENLTSMFDKNEFDIIHARNTLDHSFDPIKCFKQMIEVCKPNGFIITHHEVREGSNEKWQGLHQWDFYKEDDSLIISDLDKTYELNDFLTEEAQCVEIFENYDTNTCTDWVMCVLKKY